MTNTNNKTQNQNQSKGNEGQILFMVVAGVLTMWVVKNEVMIKTWLFENTFYLILGAVALIVVFLKFLMWRSRKKNKDYFERAEQMQALRPQKPRKDYYGQPSNGRKRGDD